MPLAINEDIAGRLDEVAQILAEQGANRFRVQAYQHAAAVVRAWPRPVSELFKQEGLAGLEKMPGVGESIARAIRDLLRHGRLAMLERLRGQHDPIALLSSVPGIGKVIAWQLHDELGLESLEDLEAAAHDGRLADFAGLGSKRLAGIRDSLAQRLGRIRPESGRFPPPPAEAEPPIDELLDVDDEYRREAADGHLKKIAPRRFNPRGEAWLPVMHTTRGRCHYTALYSNTARAHDLHKTHDWVVIYHEGRSGERRYTVITSEFGPLAGRRIVRGREAECVLHYRMTGAGFDRGVNPTAAAVTSDRFAGASRSLASR